MLESVTASLIAAGLARGTEYGVKSIAERLRRETPINLASNVFEKELQESLERLGNENSEIDSKFVEKHWDDISNKLENFDAVYQGDRETISKITKVIINHVDSRNPDIEAAVESAVASGYSKGITVFKKEVSGTDFADQIGFEFDKEILGVLSNLEEQIRILSANLDSLRFYHVFEADEPGWRAARSYLYDQENVNSRVEYVSREEGVNTQRQLIIGRKGAGKSRELGHKLPTVCRDSVSSIVIAKRALTQQEDLRPLLREDFLGDVLLVWDDIHKVDPENNNKLVREAVLKLEDVLGRENDELHVLAAARSDELDSISGYNQPDDSIWSRFDVIELNTLTHRQVKNLVERCINEFEIEAADPVKTEFCKRTLEIDPTPFYIVSVLAYSAYKHNSLSPKILNALPADAAQVWEQQYRKIKKDASSPERFILWTIRILSEINLPYFEELVRNISLELFEVPEYEFQPAIDALHHQQWITEPDNDTGAPILLVHDIQTEAINEEVGRYLEGVSQIFIEELEGIFGEDLGYWQTIAHRNLALACFSRGLSEIAEPHFERALELEPDRVDTLNGFGAYLAQTGEKQRAKELFERAIEIDDSFIGVFDNYGDLLHQLGEYEKAVEAYERAILNQVQTPATFNNFANTIAELGNIENASALYEVGIGLAPWMPEIHENYANHLLSIGEPKKAEYELKTAIRFGGDTPSVRATMGDVYRVQEKYEESRDEYETAVDHGLDDEGIRAGHCLTLLALGEEKEALERLKTAAEDYPNSVDIQIVLAQVLVSIEDIKEAKIAFRRATEIEDETGVSGVQLLEARYSFIDQLIDRGKTESARTQLELIKQSQRDSRYYRKWGRTAIEAGKPEKALELFRQAVDISPEEAVNHTHIGAAHAELGNQVKSLLSYKKAIELDKTSWEAAYNIGKVFRDAGKLEDALSLMTRIPEGSDLYLEAQNVIGNIHTERSEYGSAENAYQNALSKNANSHRIYNNYARVHAEQNELEKAVDKLEEAITINPEYLTAQLSLIDLLRDLGRVEEADKHMEQAAQIMRENGDMSALMDHVEGKEIRDSR